MHVHTETPIIERDEFASFRPDNWEYRALIPLPDNEPMRFSFHFPRHVLDARMSGLELAEFVIKHICWIIDCRLFSSYPPAEEEFIRIRDKILTSSKETLDEVLPWFQVEEQDEEDTILTLDLKEQRIFTKRTTYSAPGVMPGWTLSTKLVLPGQLSETFCKPTPAVRPFDPADERWRNP